MQVEPYAFQEAEQLRLGRFPVLDTILYRWARQIEETLFERFQIEIYAGASIVEEMRFASFFASLKTPKPVYFFELTPMRGQGLLVLDNRFANLCLARPNERRSPLGAGATDQVLLAPHNQGRLQEVVQRLLLDFDRSWRGIHQVQTHLRRITTYLFRTRILSSHERCLVSQIHLSGDQISARLTWCFPRLMLEPLLPLLRNDRVVPTIVPERQALPNLGSTTSMEELVYRVKVSLGRLNPQRGKVSLREGTLIPLGAPGGGDAIISVNGKPLLLGSIGDSEGRYAIKVTAPYTDRRAALAQPQVPFREIHWPEVS